MNIFIINKDSESDTQIPDDRNHLSFYRFAKSHIWQLWTSDFQISEDRCQVSRVQWPVSTRWEDVGLVVT